MPRAARTSGEVRADGHRSLRQRRDEADPEAADQQPRQGNLVSGRNKQRRERKGQQALGRERHEPHSVAQEGDPTLPLESFEIYDGTIVKYDDTKGYGFIHCVELNQLYGKDIFVHEQQLKGTGLGCNDRVNFQLMTNSKGQPQACHLTPADLGRDGADADVDVEGVVFRGTIKKKGKENHTFINCPETKVFYGQDVFVHPSKVGGFDVGDPVRFTVTVNTPKGQPQAQTLNSVLPPELTMSRGSQGDLAEPGAPNYNNCTHEGTIKSFDQDRGVGFIECEALTVMYGCDTTMDTKKFAGFQVGDAVRFSIRVVRAGGLDHQPQAVELYRVVPEPEPAEPEARDVAAAVDGPHRYDGVVKMLDSEKGFGFIRCQDIHERCGTDVYVDKKDMKGLSVGLRVFFEAKTNAKGKLQAVQLDTGQKPRGGDEAAGDAGAEGPEEVACSGFIKSFDEAHGYGFISSAEVQAKHNRDVFLHHAQIKSFKVGDHVLFYVRINSKGAPQAYDLREVPRTLAWLSADKEQPAVAPLKAKLPAEEEHVGVIKSFNASKGYGFIDCRALFDQYGRDVFIHQSQFEGRKTGDRVTFKVQVVKGQPQARDVALSQASASNPASPVLGPAAAPAVAAAASAAAAELQDLEADVLHRRLLRACASARVESFEVMQDLLVAGASANAPDEATDQLPLQVCALNVRHAERKCRLLVEHRADVQAKCTETHTVLQWAKERINPKFAAYLEALRSGVAHAASDEVLLENPPEEF